MTKEKVTVGVTDAGAQHLAALMDTEWFETEMAVYLLAISTALARNLVVSEKPLAGVKTKFNVGSLDRDGRLRDLVQLMGPENLSDPYEYAEKLAEVGLEFLKNKFVDQDLLLSDVLSPDFSKTTDTSVKGIEETSTS